MDNAVSFINSTYPLDSEIPLDSAIQRLSNWEQKNKFKHKGKDLKIRQAQTYY